MQHRSLHESATKAESDSKAIEKEKQLLTQAMQAVTSLSINPDPLGDSDNTIVCRPHSGVARKYSDDNLVSPKHSPPRRRIGDDFASPVASHTADDNLVSRRFDEAFYDFGSRPAMPQSPDKDNNLVSQRVTNEYYSRVAPFSVEDKTVPEGDQLPLTIPEMPESERPQGSLADLPPELEELSIVPPKGHREWQKRKQQ